jgi:hypothetical protein
MAKVFTNGQTKGLIWAFGSKIRCKGMAFLSGQTVGSTKEIMKRIRRKERGFSLGKTGANM